MIKKEITITNSFGLESKSAALFIQKATNFKSSVWIEKGERRANAKSLLGLLSMSLANGVKIMLIVEGEDEEIAADALVKYTEKGFKDNEGS